MVSYVFRQQIVVSWAMQYFINLCIQSYFSFKTSFVGGFKICPVFLQLLWNTQIYKDIQKDIVGLTLWIDMNYTWFFFLFNVWHFMMEIGSKVILLIPQTKMVLFLLQLYKWDYELITILFVENLLNFTVKSCQRYFIKHSLLSSPELTEVEKLRSIWYSDNHSNSLARNPWYAAVGC